MIYTTTIPSPLAELTLASDGENLIGLWLQGQKYFAATLKQEPLPKDDLLVFQKCEAWLTRYFNKEQPDPLNLPLKPAGTAFYQQVFKQLLQIPYGQTITYGQIAKELTLQGKNSSLPYRAVGGAVGHNPISIIIPCHRVVGASGSLTGYAGGLDKKIALLELEGVNVSEFHIPNTPTAY